MNRTHNKIVNEFFKNCKSKSPEAYEETCEKYPVLSSYQWQRIREREIPFAVLADDDLATLGIEGSDVDES